jgi:hypothetical protein
MNRDKGFSISRAEPAASYLLRVDNLRKPADDDDDDDDDDDALP